MGVGAPRYLPPSIRLPLVVTPTDEQDRAQGADLAAQVQQEPAAQLNLFLGQNAIEGVSDWVSRVKAEEGEE